MLETLILIVIIASISYLMEEFAKRNIIPAFISRKILHFSAITIAAFSPFIVSSKLILLSAGIASIIITFMLVKRNIFRPVLAEQRKSWGIVYITISFTLLVYFFYEHKWIITVSLLVVAISDSLACLGGTFWGKSPFNLTGTKKTILGSSMFFISTVIVLLISRNVLVINGGDLFTAGTFEPFTFVMLTISAALILTVTEAISSNGSDNITVPVFAAILLYTLPVLGTPELIYNFFVGLTLAGIVVVISFKLRFLSASGSAATFLLAGIIFGFGGWKWSIPILTFFILSSVLSKIRKKTGKQIETMFEKTSVRDHWQVLANGGLGGILILIDQIYPDELNYVLYVASLAAVCADTWATEIGTFTRTNTYNILNFKPIEQGTSGGVSVIGTTGAVLGAFAIALSGLGWIDQAKLSLVSYIVLAGVIGSLFDSYLGATIQAQFKCAQCEKITEKKYHCEQTTVPYKGLLWMNNDFVNLCAGISGIVVIIFLISVL